MRNGTTTDKPRRVRGRRAAVFGAAVAIASLGTAGCKRGALAEWLAKKKEGASSPAGPSPTSAFQLRALDCPDGLARCAGGVVEVSRVAHIPMPCTANATTNCDCPWAWAADCARGCAVEGLTVVSAADRAAQRLCAVDPATIARPAPAAIAPKGACEAPGYRCVQSMIVACSDDADDAGTPRAQVIAACLHGCFREGESLDADDADPEGAPRILCARAP